MLIFQIDCATFHVEFFILREQNQVIIAPAWTQIIQYTYIFTMPTLLSMFFNFTEMENTIVRSS